MMFRWLLVVACCGCNTIYGLDETTQRDPDARPKCMAGAPFGAGVEVPIVGDHSVEAARFTRNRSVAYLSLCPTNLADPRPGCDIYTSPYSLETESFSGFSKMTGVSSGVYDAYPTITADNQNIVFGSERASGVHIYTAATTNGSFDNPTITPLSAMSTVNTNEPYLVGNGRVLYFSAETSSVVLYRMEGDPPQFGGQPKAVPGVNRSNADEFAPVVRDDELEIFFASGADASVLDIYSASRRSTSASFDPPTRLDLSTTGVDWPAWITPDGCDLYYISKPTVASVAKLYVARR